MLEEYQRSGTVVEGGKGKGISKSLVVKLDFGRAQALILHHQINGTRYREQKPKVILEVLSSDDKGEISTSVDAQSEFSAGEEDELLDELLDEDLEEELELEIKMEEGNDNETTDTGVSKSTDLWTGKGTRKDWTGKYKPTGRRRRRRGKARAPIPEFTSTTSRPETFIHIISGKPIQRSWTVGKEPKLGRFNMRGSVYQLEDVNPSTVVCQDEGLLGEEDDEGWETEEVDWEMLGIKGLRNYATMHPNDIGTDIQQVMNRKILMLEQKDEK
ncbi:hypothetical protein BOTCAL_0010g00070 [Botryotinia calthae]|uniref:Uncharacterized protein n=1 Tax=Botryotinia calthae TaxID=38488 RepID=A0A4Y8DGI7_9HELO|nr:hypothetical protein BOTCAL_0010g00070 [Botryotinia calthae]